VIRQAAKMQNFGTGAAWGYTGFKDYQRQASMPMNFGGPVGTIAWLNHLCTVTVPGVRKVNITSPVHGEVGVQITEVSCAGNDEKDVAIALQQMLDKEGVVGCKYNVSLATPRATVMRAVKQTENVVSARWMFEHCIPAAIESELQRRLKPMLLGFEDVVVYAKNEENGVNVNEYRVHVTYRDSTDRLSHIWAEIKY